MNKFLENLRREAEENPVAALAAAAALLTAITSFRNSNSWRKETNRRVKMSKK
jgi:hypothetical protein